VRVGTRGLGLDAAVWEPRCASGPPPDSLAFTVGEAAGASRGAPEKVSPRLLPEL